MTSVSCSDALGYPDRISDGDTIVISGGGLNKTLVIKKNTQAKLSRCGNVFVGSLIGQRYGDVFAFDDKRRTLEPTLETPELDRSEIQADQVLEESKDNRELFDTHGANQTLTSDEIRAMREEHGAETVITSLIENSATFANKTAFAQEKYLRKKKGKYTVKFKVERVHPDNLCETLVPTLLVTANEEEDTKRRLAIRADTMGLILHHANVSGNMRVMIHDRSNGLLPAAIMYRLGAEGQVYGVYDKTSMPACAFSRQMHIPDWRRRWKALPASPQLFCDEAAAIAEQTPVTESREARRQAWKEKEGITDAKDKEKEKEADEEANNSKFPSQWLRAIDARRDLATRPADSLIVAGFEDEIVPVVRKLFPFLALSGSLVVYCPFIAPLERVYALIRDEAVCISISDTWYRHQQVLPGRTHPQVNMSTAGGFILTAVKVEPAHGGPSEIGAGPTLAGMEAALAKASADAKAAAAVVGEKRERDEAEQPSRAEAEKAE